MYSLLAASIAVLGSYLYPLLAAGSLKASLHSLSPLTLASVLATIAFLLAGLNMTYKGVKPGLVFAYNCFVKPVWKMVVGGKGKDGAHQDRLEEFYAGQAG